MLLGTLSYHDTSTAFRSSLHDERNTGFDVIYRLSLATHAHRGLCKRSPSIGRSTLVRPRVTIYKQCNNLSIRGQISVHTLVDMEITELQKMIKLVSFRLTHKLTRSFTSVCITPGHKAWDHTPKEMARTGQKRTGSMLQSTQYCHVSFTLTFTVLI
jgi:hypothetical protein